MKKSTILCLVFLLSKNRIYGQNNTLTEALDNAFDSMCGLSTLYGFNAAIVLPDGRLWKRAYGLAEEIPAPKALTTDHLMAMGSITKSFIAVTLFTTVEDSLLDLDDPIGNYLAPYLNVPPEATIRQLLSHRSGISDYLNENPAMEQEISAYPDSIWIVDTLLNHFVLAPNFPVGTSYSYSNTNYLLVGKIIETISGQPWYEAVRTRVLEPIGLTHTFAYTWKTPGNQSVAHVFVDVTGDSIPDDVQGNGFALEGEYSAASTAGCLLSNPEDIAKFTKAVHGGSFLEPATLAAMHTDEGFQYGLGAFMMN